MGYFQVRYDSRVIIYDRRAFIRLATGVSVTIFGDILKGLEFFEGIGLVFGYILNLL